MQSKFTKEQEELRKEVKDFLRRELTDDIIRETEADGHVFGSPLSRKFVQKLGDKGWLTPTWPKQYGGLEASVIDQFLIYDELTYAGGPQYFLAATMAGPTILRYGSEELKKDFLPRIARGEIEFSLGYTEPGAGSDFAGLQTRALDKGDYFLVNGQKIYNTNAHLADYHWLAVRTDPNVAKHKGISLLIVDMKTPGISVRPLWEMGGYRSNEVFYDDVQVPKKNLVGEKNQGWHYLMTALALERMYPIGLYQRLFEQLMQYCKEKEHNGRPLSKDAVVRQKLADIAIELKVANLMYYWLAYLLNEGKDVSWQASMQKVFMSEACQHLTQSGMQILGLYGPITSESKWSPLEGKMEWHYCQSGVLTIWGGTSEIQRDIIATRGLGLPRV
jgi:alkylation response protein AidB-like acyl-CoA dehydrogenase